MLYTCIYSTLVPSSNKSRANRNREDGSETKSVRARERERERERERDASPKEISLSNWQILYIVYKECYA